MPTLNYNLYWIVPVPSTVLTPTDLATWAAAQGHVPVARPRLSRDGTQAIIETECSTTIPTAVGGPWSEDEMLDVIVGAQAQWGMD